jgi:hypothetical protein
MLNNQKQSPPVIIFAHQRSGSSNMARFLEAVKHKPAPTKEELRKYIMMEPFSPGAVKKHLKDINYITLRQLRRYARKVCADGRLIKHIYGNYPFILDELIASFCKTRWAVILYRENVHQAALSAAIAQISDDWGTVNEDLVRAKSEVSPLLLRTYARKYKLAQDTLLKVFSGKRNTTVVKYEDLYSSDEQQRRTRAMQLCKAINLVPTNFDEAFELYLSPQKKINSGDTYSLISNFDSLSKMYPELLK